MNYYNTNSQELAIKAHSDKYFNYRFKYFVFDFDNKDYETFNIAFPEPSLILEEPNNRFLAIYKLYGRFTTKKQKVAYKAVYIKLNMVMPDKIRLLDLSSQDINQMIKGEQLPIGVNLSDFDHLLGGVNRDIKLKLKLSNISCRYTRSSVGDEFFDRARWLIYQDKKDGCLSVENSIKHLKRVNREHFNLKYTMSTITAKAKNITEWTRKNFTPTSRKVISARAYRKKTGKKEEDIMTRQEASEHANAVKTQRVKTKINMGINLLKMQGIKITVRSLAEVADVSRSSTTKYLKQMRENGEV